MNKKSTMKIIVFLATLIVAINAHLSDNDQWTAFKVKYSKDYHLIEENLRFKIFQNNLREIEEHNAKYEKGEETYFLKVTKFADWTEEEFGDMLKLQAINKPEKTASEEFQFDSNLILPSEIDWRKKGAVSKVKDQGSCGSCWAFSSTGALEAQLAIHKNKSVLLSEQELVDCDKSNSGCDGGDMGYAFDYVKKNGLSSEDNYPYTGKDGSCKKKSKILNGISRHTFLATKEAALADGLAKVGPISIGLEANNAWKLYGGGVFQSKCGNDLNHGVLGVGYTEDYWIIKNSWGSDWGEDGYIKIKRGKKLCGIGEYLVYPSL